MLRNIISIMALCKPVQVKLVATNLQIHNFIYNKKMPENH